MSYQEFELPSLKSKAVIVVYAPRFGTILLASIFTKCSARTLSNC